MDDPGADNIFKKITKLVGRKNEVTEESILNLVDEGSDKGIIEDDQREIINNVFEFNDSVVSDMMTHRTNVLCIEKSESLTALRDIAIEEGYSRIPVYENDVDNMVGIAYIKDLLRYVDVSIPEGMTVSDIMRTPLFVPESMNCMVLFKRMIESHTQMAIVVDEYGGTAGIITLEDLIESILGNIQDEFDDEEEEIQKINENVFTVDGITDIDEIEDLLDIELPEGDYDTFGGFIISLLDYIPEDGSVVELDYENLHFKAFDIEDRRIGKVLIEKS